MNTLIVRTERGEQIVREAQRLGYLDLEDVPAENRAHLEWAAANKKKRGLRRSREAGKLNAGEGKSYLRLGTDVIDEILNSRKEASCPT